MTRLTSSRRRGRLERAGIDLRAPGARLVLAPARLRAAHRARDAPRGASPSQPTSPGPSIPLRSALSQASWAASRPPGRAAGAARRRPSAAGDRSRGWMVARARIDPDIGTRARAPGPPRRPGTPLGPARHTGAPMSTRFALASPSPGPRPACWRCSRTPPPSKGPTSARGVRREPPRVPAHARAAEHLPGAGAGARARAGRWRRSARSRRRPSCSTTSAWTRCTGSGSSSRASAGTRASRSPSRTGLRASPRGGPGRARSRC
jgi:hypothetical protein